MAQKKFSESHTEHIIDLEVKRQYEEQLDELEKLDEKHKFSAIGSIDSAFVVYAEIEIRCDKFPDTDDDQTWLFRGQAGGLIGFHAVLSGDVRTADLQKMLRETRRFQLTTTPFWSSVVFLDKKSKVLGNYQAGTVALSLGFSGGKGKWKKKQLDFSIDEMTKRIYRELDEKKLSESASRNASIDGV